MVVLFADISGYTAMSERLDPEEVRAIMNDCFEGLVPIVLDHKGYVDKFIGDCLMALFGAPVAHEDDPIQAVRAAHAMQTWIPTFADKLESSVGVRLRMRIGLHMGEVVAGQVGAEQRSDYSVMGVTVNLASRLETAAEPETILVSELLYRRTRHAFDFASPQTLQVKGKVEPVRAYRLLGERSDPQSSRGLQGFTEHMVGREAELETLLRHVREARMQGGRILSVIGDAGLGKSRLLHEFQKQLQTDVRVFTAACTPQGADIPYGLFRDLLQAIVHRLAPPTESGDISPITAALRVVTGEQEEWTPFLTALLYPEQLPDRLAILDAKTRHGLTQQAVLQLFKGLATRESVVLILDDLHWVDPLSHRLVHFLVEQMAELPLLLLVAFRPDFSPTWTGRPHSAELRLSPLTTQMFQSLLAELLPQMQIEPGLYQTILDKAEGNPLFLEEIIRSLMETGLLLKEEQGWVCQATVADLQVPDTVQLLLMSRVDRLPETAKTVLLGAAVQGTVFELDLLQEMLGDGRLPGSLDPLVEGNFIRATGASEHYQFSHSMIQEVAYRSLLRQHRRHYHGCLGEAIERRSADGLEAAYELLAYHYSRSDNRDKAITYCLKSGEHVKALYDSQKAIDYFVQVLEFCQESRQAPETRSDPRELTARSALCELHITTGQFDRAIDEGQTLLERIKLSETAPETLIAGRTNRHLGLAWSRKGDFEQAHQWLQNGLTLLQGREDKASWIELAHLWFDVAFIAYRQSTYDTAMDAVATGLRLSEQAEGLNEVARGHYLQGMIFYAQGEYTKARTFVQQGLEAREQLGDLAGMASTLNMMGNISRDEGQYGVAEAYFQRALKLWEKIGDVTNLAGGLNNLANVMMSQGQFAAATTHYRQTLQLAERIGDCFGRVLALANLGFLFIETWQLEKTMASVTEELERMPRQVRQAVRLDEAVEHLSKGLAVAESLRFLDLVSYIKSGLGECAYQQGEIDQATDLFQQALAIGNSINNRFNQAMAIRGLGKVTTAQQKWTEAEAHLKHSLEHFAALQRTQEMGRTHLELANLYFRIGDRERATSHTTLARDIFVRLNATTDLQQVTVLEQALTAA